MTAGDQLVIAGICACALMGLTACSSSGNGDDDDSGNGSQIESDLSSEEQAVAAAAGLTGLMEQAEEVGESGEGDLTQSVSSQSTGVSTSEVQTLSCDEGGPATVDTDADLPPSSVPFPVEVDNHPNVGQTDGVRARYDNCTNYFNGMMQSQDGQSEAANYGDPDSGEGVSYVRFGGLHYNGFAVIEEPLVSEGDSGELRMQGELTICLSCEGTDLATVEMVPAENGVAQSGVMVAHNFFQMDMMGEHFILALGDEDIPGGDPLVVEAMPGTGPYTDFTVDGRQAFMDDDCAYDVTYETVETLMIDGWTPAGGGEVETGKLEITDAFSGNTHTVEWTNGNMELDGAQVDQSVLDAVAGCDPAG